MRDGSLEIERWSRDSTPGEFAEMSLSSNLHLSHLITVKRVEQPRTRTEGRRRIDKSWRERAN